jgi:SH3 domain
MADHGAGTGPHTAAPTNNGISRPPLVIPTGATLLLVLHNFEARSPDELTLRKGEHIELLEKDGRN